RRVVKTLDLEHNQAFVRPTASQPHSTWKTIVKMLGAGGGEKKDTGQALNVLPLTTAVAPAISSDDLVEAKRLAPYVSALAGGLRVEPVRENRAGYNKETRLIDIDYQHGDPEVAARVVNCVAQTFVRSNLEKKNETNTSTSEFLSKRVEELQAQICAAEEKPMAYAKSNQMLSLDANENTVVDRLAGLNKQLLDAENDGEMADAEYNAANAPGAAGALADARAKGIEAAINYRILQQEIQTNKGLLDNLLQRSKENDVVLAGRPNNISVVDYAIVPDLPVGPARLRTVMFAFLLALAFGVALALFLEY